MDDPSAELVRINHKGEAHPIGVVASRRMRERVGTFRLLPAPRHVVLMRYTGEDGRRDAEDGAIVRLSGEITEPCALLDVFAMLAQTRTQGELVVLSTEAERTVFLENGNIVGAETNVERERLGNVMYRFGAINDEQHRTVMDWVTEGARYGQTAADLGIVTREQVYTYLGKQIEEIVYACLALEDGTFFFLDGFDHKRLVSHHTFSITMLLMDAVTRLDEVRYFRQKIPDASWIPMRGDRSEPAAEEYDRVFDAVDGKTSIAELGRLTGCGEFETTKSVYALMQSHHVTLHPPRITGGPQALTAIANAALATIHKRVDAEGAGSTLRETLASFAAGAGMYEVVFRGAGPEPDGTFDADRVSENVAFVAGGDPEDFLKARLHEYVSFALFTAGNTLGSDVEHELGADLEDALASLQPPGA
jgi:hypothetical protein